MPMIAGSLALNIILGIAVWLSGLSAAAKILVTVLLVGKTLLFLYSQQAGTDGLRKAGAASCIALNGGLTAYGLGTGEYRIAVSALLLLIPLVIWSLATVFDFPFRKTNQR